MKINTGFNKNFGKWFVNDVLRAIDKYSMINSNDKICVAVSGGKDSVTLLYILKYINQYSHLDFSLSALHVKTADYDMGVLQQYCESLDIEYHEEELNLGEIEQEKNICYMCARLKRGAISESLKKQSLNKIAYGHHADDVAETLFMNIVQNKKLGSFSPKVAFVNNPMVMIRPMIYLEESLVRKIHTYLLLPLLDYNCPHIDKNLRNDFKKGVARMNALFHTSNFARKVVDSLENVDQTNVWSDLW